MGNCCLVQDALTRLEALVKITVMQEARIGNHEVNRAPRWIGKASRALSHIPCLPEKINESIEDIDLTTTKSNLVGGQNYSDYSLTHCKR